MLRCLSRVALLGTLLALGFGFHPMAAHAAVNASTTTVDYSLTTSSTIPVPDSNISGPQVVALITPPGSVVPPTLSNGTQGSPLTVLPGSTGFDPSQLVVALEQCAILNRAAPTAARPCLLRRWVSSRRSSQLRPEHQQCPGQRSARTPVAHARDHHHRGFATGRDDDRRDQW